MPPTDAARLERERLDADRSYNEALTALDRAVAAVTTHPDPARDDLVRVMSALIGFLQRITAFVETKDRELADAGGRRLDALAPSLEAIAEVRMQVGVMQRAIEMLRR